MRTLGLDVGDVTIGVAVSDPLNITAQGVCTYKRIGKKRDCDEILAIAKEKEADTIVCGLPLMLSGEDSPQTVKVREFAASLENKIRSQKLGIKIEFYDERFSTKIAEGVLMMKNSDRSPGKGRKERKEIVDMLAAQVILQSYMDMQRNKGNL